LNTLKDHHPLYAYRISRASYRRALICAHKVAKRPWRSYTARRTTYGSLTRWSVTLKIEERKRTMPKVIPVPNALSQPFWDAVNEKRLIVQNCTACNRLQYPPRPVCRECGSAENLEWKETSGRGHISCYVVIEDGRLDRRFPDQPYNLALITLDEDPGINFYSNLPGTPVDKVPIGAPVEVVFEVVDPQTGQLIHEWQVVG
jgi:uncharacterized protein